MNGVWAFFLFASQVIYFKKLTSAILKLILVCWMFLTIS